METKIYTQLSKFFYKQIKNVAPTIFLGFQNSINFKLLVAVCMSLLYSDLSAQSPFVTAVCHNITVALDANGNKVLSQSNIASLSQGSVAPRGIKRIDVFPNQFDCLDTPGDSVQVKVYDNDNNLDTCYAYITILDITPPVFDSIPDSIPDIVCYTGTLPDHEILTGTDECGTPIVTTSVDPYVENNCDGFPVTYRWTISDSTGNSVGQAISFNVLPDTIAPHFDFMPDSIPDLGCAGELQIQQILTATDENCRQITVVPSVDPYTVKPCTSYEVVYRWSVSDECGNAAEDVIRSYHVQPDTIPPNIVCPSDRTFILGDVNIRLLAFDNCSNVTTQYKIDFGNNGAFDRVRQSNVIEGDIPLGTHRVLWTVSDECGNMVECTHMFTVNSGNSPTVSCKSNLAFYVKENGCIRVAANQLIESASDIETPDSVVIASVKARVTDEDVFSDSISFCCQELGMSNFEIIVEDEHGNTATCTSSLIVGDTGNYCASHDTIGDISGRITTQSGEGMSNITVHLGNAQVTKTTVSGYYKFKNLDFGKNYTVLVQHDVNPLQGVSVADILVLVNHILTGAPFSSGFSKYAADVNRDKKLNVKDIIAMRKVLLRITPKFPQSPSWSFFRTDFNPSENTGILDIQELFSIQNFSSDISLDFVGVKTGDVNGDVVYGLQGGDVDDRSSETSILAVKDIAMKEHQAYWVDFSVKDARSLEGFQMALQYDKNKVEFLNLESSQITIDNTQMRWDAENGLIYLVWNGDLQALNSGDVLFNILLKSKSSSNLKDVLNLSPRFLKPEWVSSEEIHSLDLRYDTISDEYHSVVFPNPFIQSTRIYFNNKMKNDFTLKIYSISGKLIFQRHRTFEKGRQFFEVKSTYLSTDGMFLYEISSESDVFTGKLLLN